MSNLDTYSLDDQHLASEHIILSLNGISLNNLKRDLPKYSEYVKSFSAGLSHSFRMSELTEMVHGVGGKFIADIRVSETKNGLENVINSYLDIGVDAISIDVGIGLDNLLFLKSAFSFRGLPEMIGYIIPSDQSRKSCSAVFGHDPEEMILKGVEIALQSGIVSSFMCNVTPAKKIRENPAYDRITLVVSGVTSNRSSFYGKSSHSEFCTVEDLLFTVKNSKAFIGQEVRDNINSLAIINRAIQDALNTKEEK